MNDTVALILACGVAVVVMAALAFWGLRAMGMSSDYQGRVDDADDDLE
ncbi:hypothetical protein [Nocardioides caricicola]|uniref:Methionine/alanine import family NSS transporter small subunit n=1 Tax=Nocardioides caricicola TaxID=634770 RepID=A0ABW0MZ25_9ACTN